MINVASQQQDPDSVLNFYRALIQLRKQERTLVYGRYELELVDNPQIYAYRRVLDNTEMVVLCNMSAKSARWTAEELPLEWAECVLGNYPQVDELYRLHPWEARVYKRA
jgi:alpha-glucosidase